MDSQTSGTAPCPTCGEQWTPDHACTRTEPTGNEPTPVEAATQAPTEAAPSPPVGDADRIQIPEALLNTGLFRAAWKPSSSQASDPVESIFNRIEDEPDTAPLTTTEESLLAEEPVTAEERVTAEEAAPLQEPAANHADEVAETPHLEEAAPEDAFLSAVPDVELTVPVTAGTPEDPWAGLDLKVTDVSDEHDAPRDPWADLAPANAFNDADALNDADATPAFGWSATERSDAYTEADLEVANDDARAPETATAPAPEAADEEEQEALSPIAAAEAAALAAFAASVETDAAEPDGAENSPENAVPPGHPLTPPPIPAQPFIALDETAAMDMTGALQTGPSDLEAVPEPEVSAFDLYGDSLYAPTDATTISAAPHETAAPAVAPAAPADAPWLPEVGLSAAGITSASLPESVPFAPGIGLDGNPAEPAPAPAEEQPRRRVNKGVAAGVAGAVIVAAAGGWFWWNGQKDAPVKDAFAASHSGFTSAATQLRQASSIGDIATAGAAFETNLDQQRATDEKTRESNSEVSLAARRATVAESAVAAAAAPLASLSSSDLSSWATTQDTLRESIEGLESVRDDIETAGGSTELLPTVEVVDALQETISEEVVSGAAETVMTLSAKLETATLLADIRAVGASAKEYVAPLTEAASGIDDPAQKDEMLAVVDFHRALSRFQTLRPATLDSWDETLKSAEAAAEDLGDETRSAAEAGLAAVDATVRDSRDAFETWETESAAAKAEKDADLADLATATATVDGASSTLSTLDAELDAILEDAGTRPAEGETSTVASRLDAAASSREELLADLEALTVVPRAEAALQSLVDVVSADATAVRAAATAAEACTEGCVPGSRPEVSSLDGRTTLDDWSTATQDWDAKAEAAEAAVKKRKVPARPKI